MDTKKKNVIIVKAQKTNSYSTTVKQVKARPQPQQKQTAKPRYRDMVHREASDIKSKLVKAFEKAPIPFNAYIDARDDHIRVDFTFAEKSTVQVKYEDAVKDGILDLNFLTQTAMGLVYNACMKQMTGNHFKKDIIDGEKEQILRAVEKKLRKEYFLDGRGLVLENGQVFASDGNKKEIPLENWPDMDKYILIEGDGPYMKLEHLMDVKQAAAHAFSDLMGRIKDVEIPIPRGDFKLQEQTENQDAIMALVDDMLYSKKRREIFGQTQMYWKPAIPGYTFLRDNTGVYKTCTDWAFTEYEKDYAGEVSVITSKKYQDDKKKMEDAIRDSRFTTFRRVGGVGLAEEGVTKILVSTGKKSVTIDIDIKDPLAHLDELFDRAEKEMEKVAAKLEMDNKTKFEERMADTEIHQKELLHFKRSARKLYEGETTQLIFLYMDKHGGRMTKKDLLAFMADCGADDICGLMMMFMSRQEVIRFNDENVWFAPNAKYMRLVVAESLGIENIDEAIDLLSEISKELRKERDVKQK